MRTKYFSEITEINLLAKLNSQITEKRCYYHRFKSKNWCIQYDMLISVCDLEDKKKKKSTDYSEMLLPKQNSCVLF